MKRAVVVFLNARLKLKANTSDACHGVSSFSMTFLGESSRCHDVRMLAAWRRGTFEAKLPMLSVVHARVLMI